MNAQPPGRSYLRFAWSHEATLHRKAVRLINRGLRLLPLRLKYAAGVGLRRGKPPYSLVTPGSTVVQVGAPADTLHAGRSRAAYFALLAGPAGRVIVVEPDTESASQLRAALQKLGVTNTTVVPVGAWNEATNLEFFVDREHPATNFVSGVKQYDEARIRDYDRVVVPVRRLDDILKEQNVRHVRVVSLTTNGSEAAILEGMRGILRDVEYISVAATGALTNDAMASAGFAPDSFDDRGVTYRRTGATKS